MIALFLYFILTQQSNEFHAINIHENPEEIYQGVGAISGGGATSKLLPSYDQKTRTLIYDLLFKPQFGASLDILKVEIPGDCDSTCGSESSHMHTEDEENYFRGYEWDVIKEAKKANPNIYLAALPWCFPGWVDMSPAKMAKYVTNWVKNAKKVHNITIDMIGIWNEQVYNSEYIKILRKMLNDLGFNHVSIIAADGIKAINVAIAKDPELAKIVNIIGIHYPNNVDYNFHGKPGIVSEGRTAAHFVKRFNENYINHKFTGSIFWSMTTSYLPGLPFYGAGLIVASSPWNGDFHLSRGFYEAALLTRHARKGWHFLSKHCRYFHVGGSFVIMVSPDKTDFLMLIDTTDSRSAFELRLTGLTRYKVLYVRATSDDQQFEELDPANIVNDEISYILKTKTSYSLSTIKSQDIPHPKRTSQDKFYQTYFQNFENLTHSSEAPYIAQQVGTFETIVDPSNSFYRQMVPQPPMFWGPVPLNSPYAVFPSNRGTKHQGISMDVRLPNNNAAMPFLALRATQGGIFSYLAEGIFWFYNLATDVAYVYYDLQRLLPVDEIVNAYGSKFPNNTWVHLSFSISEGGSVVAKINKKTIFNKNIKINENGFIGFGLSTFEKADFDNFKVTQH